MSPFCLVMANVDKIIEQAIAKGVSQRLTGTLESFVKQEVLNHLRQYGIEAIQTKRSNGRKIPLAEQGNLRRKIGTLVMSRVKNGIMEGVRFKLTGIQARSSADKIDVGALEEAIKTAIQKKFRRMF